MDFLESRFDRVRRYRAMAELNHGLGEDHKEYIWRCDCADSHYLRITRDDEDETWQFFYVEKIWQVSRLRDRLKMIWHGIRGKEWCFDELVLTEEIAKEVTEALGGPYPVSTIGPSEL